MQRKSKLSTGRMVELYTQQHLTCEEIGALAGLTRQGVHMALKKAGVQREEGSWVTFTCDFCGDVGTRTRRQWRNAAQRYCSTACYYASLEKGYQPWRQGQRLARALVERHFRLEPEHVVHHKDRNNRNNDLSNLAVFASQADHMRHHRGAQVEPLWDGAAT